MLFGSKFKWTGAVEISWVNSIGYAIDREAIVCRVAGGYVEGDGVNRLITVLLVIASLWADRLESIDLLLMRDWTLVFMS